MLNEFKNTAIEKKLNLDMLTKIIFKEPKNKESASCKAFCFFIYEDVLVGFSCIISKKLLDCYDLSEARELILKYYNQRHSFAEKTFSSFFIADKYKQCASYIDSLAYTTNLCLKQVAKLDTEQNKLLLNCISENNISRCFEELQSGSKPFEIYNNLLLNSGSLKILAFDDEIDNFLSKKSIHCSFEKA